MKIQKGTWKSDICVIGVLVWITAISIGLLWYGIVYVPEKQREDLKRDVEIIRKANQ